MAPSTAKRFPLHRREYFLIQIWEPGGPTYQEIFEGKHAQELANHQSNKALVAIAAR